MVMKIEVRRSISHGINFANVNPIDICSWTWEGITMHPYTQSLLGGFALLSFLSQTYR